MSQRVKTSARALVLTLSFQPENGHLRKNVCSFDLSFFSSLHCLSFFDLRLLVTSLVSKIFSSHLISAPDHYFISTDYYFKLVWLLKLDNWLEQRQILIVLIIMDIRQMFRYRIYTTENTQNTPLATNRT